MHTASGIVKPILLPAAIVDEMELKLLSAHHQEHKTVHTASGIVKPILLPAASRGVTFTLQMNTCPLITLFGIPRNLRTSIGSQ